MGLARVSGLFRLTRDAELKYGQSGSAIVKLGLACSEKFGDKETQLFIDATAFGKPAEIISQYAGAKGTQIYLHGKLQTESWESDGQKRSKTTMIIEGFDFVSGGKPERKEPEVVYEKKQMPEVPVYEVSEEVLPF